MPTRDRLVVVACAVVVAAFGVNASASEKLTVAVLSPLNSADLITNPFADLPHEQRVLQVVRDQRLLPERVEVSIESPALHSDTDFAALTREMIAGRGPDVLLVSQNVAHRLADAGAIVPIEGPILQLGGLRDIKRKLYPSALATAMWKHHLIGLPQVMGFDAMYYDADALKQAGITIPDDWDWDQFTQILEKLKPVQAKRNAEFKHDRMPRPIATPAAVDVAPWAWVGFLRSNGAHQTDWASLLDSADAREALSWLEAIDHSGLMQPTNARGSVLVGAQATLLAPDGTWAYWSFLQHSSALVAPRTTLAVAPLPRSPYTGQSVTNVYTTLYVINKASHPLPEAAEYVAGALSVPAQSTALDLWGFPVRGDVEFPTPPGLPEYARIVQMAMSAQAPPIDASGDDHYRRLRVWMSFPKMMDGKLTVEQFIKQVTDAFK